MSAITDDLVQSITRQIVERFHPKRIIAFGSYARGDHGPNSDLDLIVEMETDRPFYQRSVDVASIFGLRDWSMDLLVYTPEEYSEQKQIWGTLISLIEPEAKVLYDRSKQ
jgi:uncharacterized protein